MGLGSGLGLLGAVDEGSLHGLELMSLDED